MLTLQRRRFVAILAVLLVAGPAMRASAGARPFVVVLDGQASPVFVDACTIQNNESGTGHASHMGTITWQTVETVNLCADPGVGIVTGQFVLTSAHGDQVTGSYKTVAQLNFAADQVRAAGLYTVTGGTGRFAGATGEGIISAVGSLSPPFDLLGQMVGEISF